VDRRLAAILAADIVGYSRLIATDEEGTLATLKTYQTTISDLIAEHSGRIFGTAGDSIVAEFGSAVQAVRAAVAIQRALYRRNADLAADRRMELRIGLNLGDVVVEGENVLGDGVNVAARLQEAAQPAGICISGALRDQIEGKLDFRLTALGDRSLKNIPRPVPVYGVDWQREDPVAAGVLGDLLALPDKPSIAVLPFVNMSGDPEQEFFVDGLTEDIITALSHYRWFFVIARNSSFAFKGRSLDVKQIARDLGVRYVVEGSVRKVGGRVRVTGQLVDAETGAHLWAERYDRDLADIFAIQDELTQNVVGAIEPEILIGEGRRAAHKPTDNLDAYECCMRGMWHHSQMSAEHTDDAIRWQHRAIEFDPNFGRAYMALVRALTSRCSTFGYSDDIARDLSQICAAAERAVALDDRDPYSHYGMFLANIQSQRHEAALAAAQRAIDLNPNFALGHLALGWARVFIGHFAEAVAPLHSALRLSPHDPFSFMFLNRLALAHYGLGNYEESVHYSQSAITSRRTYLTLIVLLAGLGQIGRLEDARRIVGEIVAATPVDKNPYWEAAFPYANSAHRAALIEGLHKAGLNE